MRKLALLCFLLLSLQFAAAHAVEIDTAASTITVRVFKSGFFSVFAHDHTISAPLASGKLDAEKRTVELRFRTSEMKVLDPGVKDSERADIERTMKSAKVLDIERFSEIAFASTSVEPRDSGAFLVRGDLTLHGATRSIELPVSFSAGHYSGTVKLKQTDFGITPITIAGGGVKVKDIIEVHFEIVPTK